MHETLPAQPGSTLRPGPDEVNLTRPPDMPLCHTRVCARAGRTADVQVTYGTFGSRDTHDRLWPEMWGHTYPLCAACWVRNRDMIATARPHLTIRQVGTP